MNFFPYDRHGEHKIVCYFKIQQPIEALPFVVLALKLVNSGSGLHGKNLKNAIKKKIDEKNSFLDPVCFHMVKMVQKSAIPTLLHFVWVTMAPVPHVSSLLSETIIFWSYLALFLPASCSVLISSLIRQEHAD